MKYKIIIRPEAESDLKKSVQWYEEENQGLGIQFLHNVGEAIDLIRENPQLHSLIYKNIRRALIHRFPYGIFYIIDNDRVVVLAVFHFKRDPKIWKKRADKLD